MSKDRNTRFNQGREAESIVLLHLMISNKHYRACGQESWLPSYLHDKFRKVFGNPIIDAIRHFPDYATADFLIQVKSAPEWSGHPTVTIEKASYNVSLEISKNSIPVLIIWYFPQNKPNDKDELLAQFAHKIKPHEAAISRNDLAGSMTPMLLVPISQLEPIANFGI